MNRLAVPAASSTPWQSIIPQTPGSGIGPALVECHPHKIADAPVATFLPLNYEPGYAYPLVVWLHDSGGNERHLPQVMQHLSTQNYVAVAPRAIDESLDSMRGYRWVQQPDAILAASEAVSDAIDLAKEHFSIHDDRVFLVGHGDGGSMAVRLAALSPERFAGVATINGRLPQRHALMRNLNHLRQLPFFVASARDHQTYREHQVCNDLRLLHSAGCGVALRQYPGSDDLTTCMLDDVNRWLMDQVCGA